MRSAQEDRQHEGVGQPVRRELRQLEEVVEGHVRDGAVDRRRQAGRRLAHGADPRDEGHAHEQGRARLVHRHPREERGEAATRSARRRAPPAQARRDQGSLWGGVELVKYLVAIGADRPRTGCATTPTCSAGSSHGPGADLRHALGGRLRRRTPRTPTTHSQGRSPGSPLVAARDVRRDVHRPLFHGGAAGQGRQRGTPRRSSGRSRASATRCSASK